MLYFAYGSMMDLGEMRGRCTSAKFVAVAKLPDHSLQFTRRSIKRGCGVADVVPEPGRDVWGVVLKRNLPTWTRRKASGQGVHCQKIPTCANSGRYTATATKVFRFLPGFTSPIDSQIRFCRMPHTGN